MAVKDKVLDCLNLAYTTRRDLHCHNYCRKNTPPGHRNGISNNNKYAAVDTES